MVNLDVLWWGRPYGYWDLVLLTPVRGVRRGLRMWEASLSASPPAAVASMNYIGPLHHWHWINQSDKEQNTPQQCYYTATKGISITVLSFETNARTTELFDLSLYPSMKYWVLELDWCWLIIDWLLNDCCWLLTHLTAINSFVLVNGRSTSILLWHLHPDGSNNCIESLYRSSLISHSDKTKHYITVIIQLQRTITTLSSTVLHNI